MQSASGHSQQAHQVDLAQGFVHIPGPISSTVLSELVADEIAAHCDSHTQLHGNSLACVPVSRPFAEGMGTTSPEEDAEAEGTGVTAGIGTVTGLVFHPTGPCLNQLTVSGLSVGPLALAPLAWRATKHEILEVMVRGSIDHGSITVLTR